MRKIILFILLLSWVAWAGFYAVPKSSVYVAASSNIIYDYGDEVVIESDVPVGRPVEIIRAFLDQSVRIINATDVWKIQIGGKNITGEGVVVCVVDTGVNFTSNPGLVGANATNFSVICTSGKCQITPNMDTDDTTGNATGHGTNVASIIASRDSTYRGVAYGAKLISVKALDANGVGTNESIIAAINWCIANRTTYNISIISLSLGTYTLYSDYCDTLDSSNVAAAANNAADAGMIVVAATGNDGNKSAVASPACASKVISVGAYNDTGSVADFSNYFSHMDLIAPGVGITTLLDSNTLITMSGTSQATPHVSGVIALMKQVRNNLTWSEAESILNRTAENISDPYQGSGLVDALAAVNYLIGEVDVLDTHFDVPENSSFNLTVRIRYTGLVDETANVTLDLEDMLFNSTNFTLFNGTEYGLSLNLTLPANSTREVYILGNSTKPTFLNGTISVSLPSGTRTEAVNISVFAVLANASRTLEANLTHPYVQVKVRLPPGLKNFTVSGTEQNISAEIHDSKLLANSSLDSNPGNVTSEDFIRLLFYNTSENFSQEFIFTLNISQFLPEYAENRTNKSSALLHLRLGQSGITRNLSILIRGIYNSSGLTGEAASIEEIVENINVTLNLSWASWIYIPNQTDEVKLLFISNGSATVDFCGVKTTMSSGEEINLTRCNPMQRELLNMTAPSPINASIRLRFMKPNDTRIGDFHGESEIEVIFNASTLAGGNHFNLSLSLIDNATGRAVGIDLPFSALPNLYVDGRNGNASIVRFFNLGKNYTIALNITNPSVKDLNLLGSPCIQNSTNWTGSSSNLSLNGVAVSSCRIPAGGTGQVYLNLSGGPKGTYTGWLYLYTDEALPDNFTNLTVVINITDLLNITYSGTNLTSPGRNATLNISVLLMNGSTYSKISSDNVTSIILKGPNGETLNSSYFNYTLGADFLNLSLPDMVGGQWRAEFAVRDNFSNAGSASVPFLVNNSNIDAVLSASRTSLDSGQSATVRLNISNYGLLDEVVNVSFSGCKSLAYTNVLVKNQSYNDSISFSIAPASSCTLTANISSGHFWHNQTSRDMEWKTYSLSFSVSSTTTTTVPTTAPTTAPEQTSVPQETSTTAPEGNATIQSQQAEETRNFTVLSYPEEVILMNTTNITVVVKNTGTVEDEIVVDFMSDYLKDVVASAVLQPNETKPISLVLERGDLRKGKYMSMIRVRNGEKIVSYAVMVKVQPLNFSGIVEMYEYLRSRAETLPEDRKREIQAILSAAKSLIEKGDYLGAEELLSGISIEEEKKPRRIPSKAIILTGLAAGFAVLVRISLSLLKEPGWQPERKVYEFRPKQGLADRIRDFLKKLLK